MGEAVTGVDRSVRVGITAMQDPDAQDPDALMAGMKSIGKPPHQYFLGDVLGEGSYGKVREGIHTSLKQVAIKKINMNRVKKADLKRGALDTVKTEVSILKK